MGDDWRCCFVLDPKNADDPRFIYVGDGFEASAWQPPVRKQSECPDGTLLKMASIFFSRVIEKRIPISITGVGEHLGRRILFRAIQLPLSNDGMRVDALLGAANFREAAPERT